MDKSKPNPTEKQTPLDRLNYSGELGVVIDRLASIYAIGKPASFSIIGIGYEDCNVAVETPSGKYVAKIFSKDRNSEAIARYSTIMEKAVEAGVNHPPLMKTANGEVVYSDSQANGISMVLMKFVEGQTFLELDRAPDADEQNAVVEQAVKVNGIDYQPPYLFDSWAIPNIKSMFERTKQFIQPDDIKLIEQAIAQFDEIPIENLPHCFVHGDFTKANVMKGNDGKIYILDFSVANRYPRIQELAVIAANLLHEESDLQTLRERTKRWIGRLRALYLRHELLVEEMKRRGYRHKTPLDKKFARGKARQDIFIDSIKRQKEILAGKPCACPL